MKCSRTDKAPTEKQCAATSESESEIEDETTYEDESQQVSTARQVKLDKGKAKAVTQPEDPVHKVC